MFTWKREATFGDAFRYGCHVGPWQVGNVSIAVVARGNPNKWAAHVSMPDMDAAVNFPTPEEAKQHVEKRVLYWFKQIPVTIMGAIMKENNR